MRVLDEAPRRLILPAPQLGLQDLAVVVLGQCVEENVFFWPLEAGDMIETDLIEFRLVDLFAVPGNHVGDDFLSPILVLAPDNGYFQYPGMEKQDFLDLARIYVTATGNDEILGSIFQCKKPVI